MTTKVMFEHNYNEYYHLEHPDNIIIYVIHSKSANHVKLSKQVILII